MTTATRVGELGAPVRFRLWAPLISTKSLALAGLFVICNMTTATRAGELGAPVRCPPLGTAYFYKGPSNCVPFLLINMPSPLASFFPYNFYKAGV